MVAGGGAVVNPIWQELQDSACRVMTDLGCAGDAQEAWQQVVDLGWLAVSIPEDLGGLGLGVGGAGILHMELGRGLSRAPFLTQSMAIEAVVHSSLPDKAEWLDALVAARRRVTCALIEPEFEHDERGKEVNCLRGVSRAVPDADESSHILVHVKHAYCVALVALEQANIRIDRRPTWDETRRLHDVAFDGIDLDSEIIIARGPHADGLMARLDHVRDCALAADAVGGASALLELTLEHLTTRNQFGRPLGMFQALKHRCADLKLLIEAAEAVLYQCLADGETIAGNEPAAPPDRTPVLAAKYLACDAYARVAEDCLQLHGGIGMTSEHSCHLYLKRALLNEHLGQGRDNYEIALTEACIQRYVASTGAVWPTTHREEGYHVSTS